MNKTALLFAGLAAAVLAGLFLLLKPAQTATPAVAMETPVAGTQIPPAVETPAAAAPQVFELTVRKGQLASGPSLIRVHQGEEVRLQVSSDQPDELHLHGYDLHLTLRAGVPAVLTFEAVHSGRFDYELHHSQTELGALEVLPQ